MDLLCEAVSLATMLDMRDGGVESVESMETEDQPFSDQVSDQSSDQSSNHNFVVELGDVVKLVHVTAACLKYATMYWPKPMMGRCTGAEIYTDAGYLCEAPLYSGGTSGGAIRAFLSRCETKSAAILLRRCLRVEAMCWSRAGTSTRAPG